MKPVGDARAGDLTVQTRLQKIPQWLDMIRTSDPQKQLEATTHFRKLLSIERNPPIQEVIACGVVPRLVEFLTFGDHAKLIFEAAWALTNIASGSSDQTRVVIDAGAVPIFVQLLASRDEDVREQCVWALGNIAGDSPQCRDYVLQHQVTRIRILLLVCVLKVCAQGNGSVVGKSAKLEQTLYASQRNVDSVELLSWKASAAV